MFVAFGDFFEFSNSFLDVFHHFAWQLKDGNWTSKLGKDVDISHKTLQAIEGEIYGIVRQILKRIAK
jgi:hypothetical protein